MYVLGLGGSNHGFSACLLKDGKIVNMISDERITRKKYGLGLGLSLGQGFSRNYCMDMEKITLNDIDKIVGNDILSPAMYFRLEDRVELMNHHLAHAYSVYYPSGMDECAIMVLDGVGSKRKVQDGYEYESMTLYYAENGKFHEVKKQCGCNLKGTDYVENSLGIFYALITQIIGFGEHEEGKTMGLAPYGDKTYYQQIRKLIDYDGNGNISFSTSSILEMIQLKEDIHKISNIEKKEQICANIAWAGQKVLEEIYIGISRFLLEKTQSRKLCIAGGVSLNSVANYKVYKTGMFSDFFIQPASGDDGTAIGAAYYGYYKEKEK